MGTTGNRIRGALGVVDDLVEGNEESRRAARERAWRANRVPAARASRSWLELRPDRIERRGRYIVDLHDGRLFEPLRAGVEVWENGDPSRPLNPDVADAFVVVDDDVVFLRRSRDPDTIDDLRWLEADREDQAAKARANADAKAERRARELAAFRADQPLRAVTLADVVGHDLPTIRAAVQTIQDHGGRIDARDDRTSIRIPERLAPDDGDDRTIRSGLMDCVRVVVEASKIVAPAIASSSTKDLVERLPDKAIGVDGWPVSWTTRREEDTRSGRWAMRHRNFGGSNSRWTRST